MWHLLAGDRCVCSNARTVPQASNGALSRFARPAILALLLGAISGSFSRPLGAQGVRLGAITGANFSTLRGLNDVDLDRRTGTMGGLSLILPLGGAISLQTEALVVSAGGTSPTNGDDGLFLTYAQLPLLLRLSPLAGAPISPHVYVGPYAGLRIKCQIGVDGERNDCDDVPELSTRTVDIGGIVGGGVDLDLGGIILTGGVRYSFGVSTIAELSESATREAAKNGAFSVYAGLSFRLGG